MERGNSKHGPVRDDELARELEATLRGNRPGRAGEWGEQEPSAEEEEATPFRVERP